MLKKVISFVLCLSMILALTGCNIFKRQSTVTSEPESDAESTVSENEPEPEVEKVEMYTDPLTGLSTPESKIVSLRPVAVMVNNISVAQSVQTGLNDADIIYETEVEGGVTRLMAVFKDFQSVGQIGSVRSARYPYVDLALGHDAIYIHCGQDPNYCAAHLKDIDDLSVDTGSPGTKRIPNGLSREHTLYVFGNELWSTLAGKFKTETAYTLWQNFASEDETVTFANAADRVEIPFPVQKTVFNYDSVSGLYTRFSSGSAMKDYVTKQSVRVKNVFILMTSITTYPDGMHRKVSLDGGNGYYITNGTYTEIKWQKGDAKAPIKITDTAGNPIKVSAGRSWVCIPNSRTCRPVLEGATPTATQTN